MSTAVATVLEQCANCAIELAWPAVHRAGGLPYCCDGCAAGGPCTCDYGEVWDQIAGALVRPARR